MRSLLTMSALVIAAVAFSVPASADFGYTWTDGFEGYTPGSVHGQGLWVNAGTDSPVVQNTLALSGEKALSQVAGVSIANADLRPLNAGTTPNTGWAKFWVYDPGNVPDGLGGYLQTDGRAGIHSSMGAGSVANMWSAGIVTNRSLDYWVFQWSWSPIIGDGVSGGSSTGYTFTTGPAAPRTYNAWSYVIINWAFTYNIPNDPESGGSGQVQWRVNQTGMTPNLTLDFDSTSGRWANSHDVAGVALGSRYSCATPTSFDDVQFYPVIPEPSSLLALGAGLMGLVGAIRRRR